MNQLNHLKARVNFLRGSLRQRPYGVSSETWDGQRLINYYGDVENDIKLLDLIWADNKVNSHQRWVDASVKSYKEIKKHGLYRFRSNHGIVSGYGDSLPPMPHKWVHKLLGAKYRKHLYRLNGDKQLYKELYFDLLLSGTPFNIETMVGSPSNYVVINGKKIGRSYVDMVVRINNYSHSVDFSKIKSVFEIGGGFGAFAHTILSKYKNIRKYLYLDIAPNSYVATQYLKHFFGESVLDYRHTKDNSVINFTNNDNLEIIILNPWQLNKVSTKLDLFINSSSFQEMTIPTVGYYVNYINDICTKYFLYDAYMLGKELTILIPKLREVIETNSPFKFHEECRGVLNNRYFVGKRNVV